MPDPLPTPIIFDLADEAASLRRTDIKKRIRKPMKEYFERVLKSHNLEATKETLSRMGKILGKRGGQATARKRRMKKLNVPFPETLFD